MGQVSRKLRNWADATGASGYKFWCPGCNDAHMVKTSPGGWSFNGDVEKPSFYPSIDVQSVQRWTDEEYKEYLHSGKLPVVRPLHCHSVITEGRIEFCTDCTHSLANQTVDLADWPEHYYEHPD